MKKEEIVQPMIDEMREQQEPKKDEGVVSEEPEQPAELDQDSGGGYNLDGTYPQT